MSFKLGFRIQHIQDTNHRYEALLWFKICMYDGVPMLM